MVDDSGGFGVNLFFLALQFGAFIVFVMILVAIVVFIRRMLGYGRRLRDLEQRLGDLEGSIDRVSTDEETLHESE
jgi:hypothetical protein